MNALAKISILFIPSVFVIVISCSKSDNKEIKNTYLIISKLTKKLSVPLKLPPPIYPDSFNIDEVSKESEIKGNWKTKKDSVEYFEHFGKELKKRNEELENKKQVIAFYPYLHPINVLTSLSNCHNMDYKELYGEAIKNTDSIKLDIAKIVIKRNDSIVYFNTESDKNSRDFFKLQIVLSFSTVTFNEDFTKAVIMVSVSHGKLNGIAILYFLEIRNNEWQIVCEEGLSIS